MRLRHLLAASLLLAPSLLIVPQASAQQQQGQQWFVPPGQAQGQPQRPAQGQPAQRPPQQRPAATPAGQRPPAPVIAIVDIPEVQRLSAAFNQVREEIERRRARLNEDLQREQGRWREEQQALAAARATLAPEQLRARERELQERITDAQRIFRDRSRAIDQAAQTGLQQIEQALGAVIRQVAASRGVNIVLPRPLVIFNDSGFDLTDEISAQMNRVLRSVNLPAEGAAPTEAPAAGAPAADGTPPPPPPPAPAAPAARRN
ncbi:OmpH family outer membrane protein [Falsiroseomonas tokyonensis]|uniref:OmpH family outer membrane protein n=1 Tax=Falsiroseomonas tokyonensis TaxID=430521 RepID=A0ABV7BSF5_9PROT|nr:OmpH family outer membrane protein [Falsiroseomonas tokyonensis]MBU8538121.1 OmpH family outer membrane protein [Falsiroseomonas tokyonensis]